MFPLRAPLVMAASPSVLGFKTAARVGIRAKRRRAPVSRLLGWLVALRGSVGFFPTLGAIVAADFNGLAADLHFDPLVMEIAIARRAGFLSHGMCPPFG